MLLSSSRLLLFLQPSLDLDSLEPLSTLQSRETCTCDLLVTLGLEPQSVDLQTTYGGVEIAPGGVRTAIISLKPNLEHSLAISSSQRLSP